MGSYIVREVIKELSEYNQLLFGEELYLAGSSAGGTGVLVNIDAISSMLRKSKILVRGIIDSGWFLDNDPFFNNDASKTGVGPSSVKHALQKGVQLWNARVPSACASEYPDMWQCFLGYKVFPFIKSKKNNLTRIIFEQMINNLTVPPIYLSQDLILCISFFSALVHFSMAV